LVTILPLDSEISVNIQLIIISYVFRLSLIICINFIDKTKLINFTLTKRLIYGILKFYIHTHFVKDLII